MSLFKDIYDSVIPSTSKTIFKIPNNQSDSSYFPEYLNDLLNEYRTFYNCHLKSKIDDVIKFEESEPNLLYNKIDTLTNALIKTVECYYQGKVSEASINLFETLDKLVFDEHLGLTNKINLNKTFYRARSDNGQHFSRKDLFHIDFKLRNLVSTNRFSIPGFPALYLGDTTYVCWEEFNRHRLRNLWFTKIKNEKDLNVLQIERIEDFISELDTLSDYSLKVTTLLRYLIIFPLTLACTIKVNNTKGNFKPEYIIPQLLSEYISKNEKIDGIKFPSTKVDYSKLDGVQAYNYVFPVKTVSNEGYCNNLKSIFHLTEPTSLELEEIIHNPTSYAGAIGKVTPSSNDKIELITGQKVFYSNTSFGKIEKSFVGKIFNSI
ncbi:RES domain-containing protein [Tenacibaculum finnmarkense genomovar ulcerans]|uniref:RES domain-containing protein n=1 Tax=Tenacibaculum finnmarkense TaxID=2781243 RepID=UPI00187BAD36|nr:RES domain-containing protein [Tenacibaculum finnmarkense]MBE7688983.1 RES domain-containing protein [Tenacibaculum finnmarkense genomovar ulcerans]